MKVLLVTRIVEYIDPMAIQLMSALAKRIGHSTYLTILAQDDLEEDLQRIKPDVVAFSTMTGEHLYHLKAADIVKKVRPDALTVMGGPHCSFAPQIIEHPSVDVVGMGECDDAWPALLKAYAGGGLKSLDPIKNVLTKENWFSGIKEGGAEARRKHMAGRTTFLDGLPFLDREIVYRKTHLADFPMRSHMASRGCPFECTYCFQPVFNKIYRQKGPIFNRYSVQRLCEELKEVKERWPTQFIKFYDDLFFVKPKVDDWLEEFAEVYPREVGLPFFVLTRCNILTEPVLQLLVKTGLHSLTMSIEAGDDYIRNEVIKRHMSRQQILDAFALCNKYGVVTFANSILGIPVRPEIMAAHGKKPIDYDVACLDINIAAGVTYAEFGTAYPYPGCELADYVEQNGWFDKARDFDSLHTSYQSESPLNCFTPHEKLVQKNLEQLGTVCVAFPWLRNITVNYLIHWRLPRVYFVLYYLTKGYLNIFKVYPMKLSFANLARNIVRSVRNEWNKHSPTKTLYKKPRIREGSPVQRIGGMPKI